MKRVHFTIFLGCLAALFASKSAVASGPIIAEYGETAFVVQFRAGYYGLMRNPETVIEPALDRGYWQIGRLLPELRVVVNEARKAGIPLEDFIPFAEEARLKLDKVDDGPRWSRISEDKPGELSKLLNGPFPLTLSLEYEDYCAKLTVSRRMTSGEMNRLRDMLVSVFKRHKEGGLELHPIRAMKRERLQEPWVIIEAQHHAVCATVPYMVSSEELPLVEKRLHSLASNVSTSLQAELATPNVENLPGSGLHEVKTYLKEIREEKGNDPKSICFPPPRGRDEVPEGAVVVTSRGYRSGNLTLKLVVAMERSEDREVKANTARFFDEVFERAVKEQVARIELRPPEAQIGEGARESLEQLEGGDSWRGFRFPWMLAAVVALGIAALVVRRRITGKGKER